MNRFYPIIKLLKTQTNGLIFKIFLSDFIASKFVAGLIIKKNCKIYYCLLVEAISVKMSISPFVYWAQTEEQISLKVDLKDVKVNIAYLT